MKFSVVIPTYHRIELLRMCLVCLSPNSQKLDASQYEVIVTDDGVEINAKELIEKEFPWCRWVQGPQKGPAQNRNFGVSCSVGERIIFIDDDCQPDNNLLLSYFEATLNYPEIAVFEGCIKPDRAKQRFNEESPVNLTGGYLWSCNFSIKRSLFEEIGGFDVNFPYPAMEDVDLRERIKKSRTRIVFLKNAFVIHPWRKRRSLAFVKKHFISSLYHINKNKLLKFNIKNMVLVYAHNMKYVLLNSFRFKFRGLFHELLIIHYLLLLKLGHFLRRNDIK